MAGISALSSQPQHCRVTEVSASLSGCPRTDPSSRAGIFSRRAGWVQDTVPKLSAWHPVTVLRESLLHPWSRSV
uniref:Uncharacterized protein n=1 Tax=Taeniopygia guttata TaxID=59729 RepID=A0A674GKI7_TAEGU